MGVNNLSFMASPPSFKNCLLYYKKCIVFVILPVCSDLVIVSNNETYFYDIQILWLILGWWGIIGDQKNQKLPVAVQTLHSLCNLRFVYFVIVSDIDICFYEIGIFWLILGCWRPPSGQNSQKLPASVRTNYSHCIVGPTETWTCIIGHNLVGPYKVQYGKNRHLVV